MMHSTERIDAGEIKLLLRPHAIDIGTEVFGPPVLHSRNEVRWKGSQGVVLTTAGPRAYLWCDFTAGGAGGDLLDFIRHLHGYDMRQAITFAKDRLGIRDDAPLPYRRPPPVEPEPEPDKADTIAYALRVFDRGASAHPTLLAYLRGRLGGIEPDPAWIPDLRFLPDCSFRPDGVNTIVRPAMLARLRDIKTGEPCGIQRTALLVDDERVTRDRSIMKMTLGRAKGAAVMLSAFEDVTMGIGLAEGVETGMSVLAMGWAPVWATCGTGGMASFPVLGGIDSLALWADAGAPGQNAATGCAQQWATAGREVRIMQPPDGASDMNDLMGAS